MNIAIHNYSSIAMSVQMAGMMARELLCHVSGKTADQILSDRELYAPEEVCRRLEKGLHVGS